MFVHSRPTRRVPNLRATRHRHFEETADAAKVPFDIRRRAFAELAQVGLPAIEAVADALPDGFPDRVAGPILAHARSRMLVLADYVDAGQVGR